MPPEFETGEDVVECEVFENETYGPFAGWGAPTLYGQRLKFSNRKGELSSSEFPEVRLPGDFTWEDDWRVDKTYTPCDPDGWSYALGFGKLEQDLERGESSGANSTFDMARRRRWVRSSRRVGGGAAGGGGVEINFAAAAEGEGAEATGSPSVADFGIADDDPFTDSGL